MLHDSQFMSYSVNNVLLVCNTRLVHALYINQADWFQLRNYKMLLNSQFMSYSVNVLVSAHTVHKSADWFPLRNRKMLHHSQFMTYIQYMWKCGNSMQNKVSARTVYKSADWFQLRNHKMLHDSQFMSHSVNVLLVCNTRTVHSLYINQPILALSSHWMFCHGSLFWENCQA